MVFSFGFVVVINIFTNEDVVWIKLRNFHFVVVAIASAAAGFLIFRPCTRWFSGLKPFIYFLLFIKVEFIEWSLMFWNWLFIIRVKRKYQRDHWLFRVHRHSRCRSCSRCRRRRCSWCCHYHCHVMLMLVLVLYGVNEDAEYGRIPTENVRKKTFKSN